ncbi:AEC family transporter [Nesterenkonia sp. MY13]|uniref:AEC family transporter n=1 Tax=Nesterenkonia sedimenti TaxID=1463632 RepID=A0A7X8TIB5_9MICC|nr:AEC family transporter [Nesterenkonia sedimenti]NLS08593.1 AEC family transporter [Nesterenkonia sedimenti]
MFEMLTVIAPLFLLILLGFGAGFATRFRDAAPYLNGFVFYFALPTFLFTAMTEAPPTESFPWAMPLIVLIVTPAVSIGLYYLCRLLGGATAAGAAPTSLAGTFGNVGYFGIPISIGVIGVEAGLVAGLVHVIHNVFYLNTYPIVRTVVDARSAGGSSGGFGKLWRTKLWPVIRRGILMNPMFSAIAVALIVVFTDFSLPALIEEPVGLLGGTAVPLALFCVGLALHPALEGIRSGGVPLTPIALGTAAKLLVLPVLTWAAVLPFYDQLGPDWAGVLIILAATPSSTTVFLFSSEYDGDGRLAAAILVASTALSLLTLPLVAELLL